MKENQAIIVALIALLCVTVLAFAFRYTPVKTNDGVPGVTTWENTRRFYRWTGKMKLK